MKLYYFNLRTNTGLIRDPDGTRFPDATAARANGEAVVRELMRNSQVPMRSWRMDVENADLQHEFSVLFAQHDDRLSHLAPDLRETVIDSCARSASLGDIIQDLQRTLLQAKRTVARSKGLPYVAASEGVQL
jgi:hypothetical protein